MLQSKEGAALVLGYLKGSRQNFFKGRLYYSATHDGLTGLHNREYVEESLERQAKLSQRNGSPLSVLMIDANRFKKINDTFGHDVGDEVLREIALRAIVSLRSVDILARYGGDELFAVLPDTPLMMAVSIAQRVSLNIHNDPVIVSRNTIPVTVSIGIAQYNPNRIEHIRVTADRAMYHAKRATELLENGNRIAYAQEDGSLILSL